MTLSDKQFLGTMVQTDEPKLYSKDVKEFIKKIRDRINDLHYDDCGHMCGFDEEDTNK